MAIKFAVASTTVHWRGEHVTLVLDQPWHDTDPLVIERPDLFKDEPTNVSQTSGYQPPAGDSELVVENLPPTNTRRRTR